MPIVIPIERAFDVRTLRRKPFAYWLRVLVVTLAGMLLVASLKDVQWWRELTAATYQTVSSVRHRTLSAPGATGVVLIDDDDYWSPLFAGRAPLNRTALAAVVDALAAQKPRVIALDVDLSTPSWRGSPEEVAAQREAYHREMQPLLDALRRAGADSFVVLSRSVRYDSTRHVFVTMPDEFDDLAQTMGERLLPAYTRVPRDPRQIPTQIEVETDGGRQLLDSFALAIARARNPQRTYPHAGEPLPFGDFMAESAFAPVRASATGVIRDPVAARRVAYNGVVLIGGGWSERGEPIDLHVTPAGRMPGVLVHANYVEALLGEYTTAHSELASMILEITAAALMAVIFVGAVGRWKVGLLVALGVATLPVSLISLQNFGTYFDGIVLLLLLGAHAAIEQVLEWREESHHDHRPRGWVARAAWTASLIVVFSGLATVMYSRHNAERKHHESTAALRSEERAAAAENETREVRVHAAATAVAAVAPPPKAAADMSSNPLPPPHDAAGDLTRPSSTVNEAGARHESPAAFSLLARLEDSFADDVANHLFVDARVRGGIECRMPPLDGFESRLSGRGTLLIRVPQPLSSAGSAELISALSTLNNGHVQFYVIRPRPTAAADSGKAADDERAEALLTELRSADIKVELLEPLWRDTVSAPAGELYLAARCPVGFE